MNYEKKYKSALEWIRSIYPTMQGADKEDAEHYFPELKDGEDERIRKEIINYFKCQSRDEPSRKNIHDKWIAWLEKQGEQKSWSEEDDYVYNEILKRVADKKLYEHDLEYIYTWLKSLKPNHWKPSEEQLNMLLAVLNDSNNITSESVQIALKSLYNDLKKL